MESTLLLFFLPLLTSAYNLDVLYASYYRRPSNSTGIDHSYFGYSVILCTINMTSLVIVGAPRANYVGQEGNGRGTLDEPGVVFVCTPGGSCKPLTIGSSMNQPTGVPYNSSDGIIKEEHGWFGAAMSIHESDDSLTVCAPRTTIDIFSSGEDYRTMHGVCYNGKLSSGNLTIEDKDFSTYLFYTTNWVDPLNGFAVHYPRRQTATIPVRPVVGAPTHKLDGSVRKMGLYEYARLPTFGTYNSLFGYAISSGNYFKKSELMMAAGAPDGELVGLVAIRYYTNISNQSLVTPIIKGTKIGEFFGASLATGDMNNDGLDDLIVGAPHWGNDNGRVYIFLGNKDGFSNADVLLEGSVDDALYGYAMTCGDLDRDGYDDLIVGAPWEESGVIYVYNGDTKLGSFQPFRASQRIAASSIDIHFRTFGFSFSELVDVNNDDFPDVAVGGYASGHTVLILSRRIVNTTITLSTVPSILQRNSTKFVLQICVNQTPYHYDRMFDSKIHITVDEQYNRAVNTFNTIVLFEQPTTLRCHNRTIQLQRKIHNYLASIEIVAKNEFSHRAPFPIGYKAQNATARTELSFDTGCGVNGSCKAFLIPSLKFRGVRDDTCIIGTRELDLALVVKNTGDPAYSTRATFNIPKGVYLKIVWPSCSEEEDERGLTVTCEIGNPLEAAASKRMFLNFVMSGLDDTLVDVTELNFTANITTLSENLGSSTVVRTLRLKANVSFDLSGKNDKDGCVPYYQKHLELDFQQNYQISRHGITPISEVLLKIMVPYKSGDSQFLTITHKPRVSLQGNFHECSVCGIPVLNRAIDESLGASSEDCSSTSNMNAISHSSVVSNVRQLQWDDVGEPQSYTKLEVESSENVYLNCSTPNITCGIVACRIPFRNIAPCTGWIPVQVVVNISDFIDSTVEDDEADENDKNINFSTEAYVEVVKSKMPFDIPGTRIAVPVATKFCRIVDPGTQRNIMDTIRKKHSTGVNAQIIVGSMLLGLLILGLIAVILRYKGFFERKKKKALEALISEEIMAMDVEGDDTGNETHEE